MPLGDNATFWCQTTLFDSTFTSWIVSLPFSEVLYDTTVPGDVTDLERKGIFAESIDRTTNITVLASLNNNGTRFQCRQLELNLLPVFSEIASLTVIGMSNKSG